MKRFFSSRRVQKGDACSSNRLKIQARGVLCRIHLVDKCLLVFMAVLLLQSVYSLISSGGAYSESNHIDIIIRTSAAAIFGYFLSGNFIRHSDPSKSGASKMPQRTEPAKSAKASGVTPLARIGFSDSDAPASLEAGGIDAVDYGPSESADATRLQILTAAGIGLFCLIVLILFRNFSGWDDTINPSVTATVAQLRDFVSGSVGFLLGSPTSSTDRNG